jgi:ABC-2 type transport system ATP-binding protein
MARGRIAAVGTLAQIRDLLDDHPLTIRVDLGPERASNGDGAAPATDRRRELAGALLGLPDVVGVDLGEGHSLLVCARNPRQFYRDFARLVVEESYEVRHLETLDDSAEAILGYLLGGRRVTG